MFIALARGGRFGTASDPARPAVFPATRRRFRVGMAEGRHGGDVRGLLNWASQQSSSSLSPAVSRRPSIIMSSMPSASPGPALLPVDMTWSLVLALTSAENFRLKASRARGKQTPKPDMKLLLLSTIACSMAAASGQDTVSVAIGEDVSDRCPEGQEWPGGSIQECRVMPGPRTGRGGSVIGHCSAMT
ncbi:hypothetical protein THAOC_30700, partial [Thalassiosira oceanica]